MPSKSELIATTPVTRRGRGRLKEQELGKPASEEETSPSPTNEGSNQEPVILFDPDDNVADAENENNNGENQSESWSEFEDQPGAVAIDGPHIPIEDDETSNDEDDDLNPSSPPDSDPVVTTAKVVDEQAERKRVIASATEEELRDRILATSSRSGSGEVVVATADRKPIWVPICTIASVIVAVVVIVQPLASVTVTVYVPAAKPVSVAADPPLLHAYVYPGVPLFPAAVAEPVELPLQSTFV